MNPTFLQIWRDKDWFDFFYSRAVIEQYPIHTREYYKFRSVVRMAVWIPIIAYMYYLVLGAI